MHIHVLQHVPFEGPGSIAAWSMQVGAQLTFTRFFDSTVLPPLAGIDLVIAMGGPMSVNDEQQFPWLREEKGFIADAIHGGTAVLGICLGAQLIASALGARVYPGADKEIGWFPVFAAPAAADAFVFPASVTAFHWHGETFDLPAGAIRLASSVACRNQAFQVGPRAVGLQFHLETTPESADALIGQCADELVAGPHIQSEQVLRQAPAGNYVRANDLMTSVLDYLCGGAGR